MPYLSVELDARRKAAMIANGLGLHPGVVMWGLEELWEISWRTKTDTTTQVGLAGCFGPDVERMMPALLVHGFLEPLDGGAYRVRGASRYLRIRAAQSAAGHAAKGNLRRGRGAGTGERASPGGAGEAPGSVSGSAPALTAISDQRSASILESTPLAGAVAPALEPLASGPVQTPTPPAKDAQEPAQAASRGDFRLVEQGTGKRERKPSAAQEFATWAAERSGRQETLARGTWVHVAEGLKRYGVERLRAAYVAFLADAWARSLDPPCPMRAFAAPSKLEEYVSAGDRRGSAGGPPDCEVCGRPCQHKEHGRDLCEGCRSAFLGDRVAAGWEWTPDVTEESERVAVAEWIKRQTETRRD